MIPIEIDAMCINYQFYIILKFFFELLNQPRVCLIISESSKEVNPGSNIDVQKNHFSWERISTKNGWRKISRWWRGVLLIILALIWTVSNFHLMGVKRLS